MRVLPAIALTLLCAACAAPAVDGDGWGVLRRFEGPTPALLSISEINTGSMPASGAVRAMPVRTRERGRHRIVLAAEQDIASTWTVGAALFDADLDRALDWLGRLGAHEPRGVELRLTLMPMQGARRQQQLHPAGDTLVVDLLVPVPAQPRSRGAALESALATGLHEASHALRPHIARDRDDDEYRASLVAACFRIGGMQSRDAIAFPGSGAATPREFTRARSRDAALAVKRDLAAALGKNRLEGRDHAGIASLSSYCDHRLGLPAR